MSLRLYSLVISVLFLKLSIDTYTQEIFYMCYMEILILVQRELDLRKRKESRKVSGIPHLQLFGQLSELRQVIWTEMTCDL